MAKATLPITQELAGWIYECWMTPDARRSARLDQETLALGSSKRLEGPENFPVTNHHIINERLKDLRETHRNCFIKLTEVGNQLPFFLSATDELRHEVIREDILRLRNASELLHRQMNELEPSLFAFIESMKVKPYLEWVADLKMIDMPEPVRLPGTSPFYHGCQEKDRQDFYKELLALEREFGEVTVTTEHCGASWELLQGTFTVTTKTPVIFDDPNNSSEQIDLGKFEIMFRSPYGLDRSSSVLPPLARAITPNYPDNSDDITHPNVRDNSMCMGDAQTAFDNAISARRFSDAALLMNAVLFNDGEIESPYRSLDTWNGTGKSCSDCGVTIYSEDGLFFCERCGDASCGDCILFCTVCDTCFCPYHVFNCLHKDIKECDKAEDKMCGSCLNDHNNLVAYRIDESKKKDISEIQTEFVHFGAAGRTANEVESIQVLDEHRPL
jgi:hypothetical protein